MVALMSRNPIRAALIDLDGTLVDTLSEMTAAANAMLADAGRPSIESEVVAAAVGEGASMLVDHLLGPGSSARWLPVYLDHYRAINGTIATLYPNVKAGLEAMRADGLMLACVTNKPRELVGPLLVYLGVASLFDATIGGGDTIEKKPKPDPLFAACKRLGIDATETVMVGDSINDAAAANAAGAISLTVPYGYPGSGGDADRAPRLYERGITCAIVADLLAAAQWIAAHNASGEHDVLRSDA
jgi:phosphoglycolate phosphatase